MQPAIELNKLMKVISRSTREKRTDPQQQQSEPHAYNPYLAARREWDERYGDLVARAKIATRIALICGALAFLLAAIAGALALRGPKIIFIPLDPTGRYLGPGAPEHSLIVTDATKRSAVSDWVTYLRTVTSDDISQRWAIEKVYAMISSGSSAQTVVSDFYRGDPPQVRARHENVHLEINSILPTSDKTYEVEWLEITRDLGGRVVSQQRWKGIFTFIIRGSPPADERLARLNPIGLFMTSASWSKIL